MENISKEAIKELKRMETIQARKDRDIEFLIDTASRCLEAIGVINEAHMKICDMILNNAGMIFDKAKDDINFK